MSQDKKPKTYIIKTDKIYSMPPFVHYIPNYLGYAVVKTYAIIDDSNSNITRWTGEILYSLRPKQVMLPKYDDIDDRRDLINKRLSLVFDTPFKSKSECEKYIRDFLEEYYYEVIEYERSSV